MIYLLGGSGYVGRAYQDYLTQRGIVFRSLSRAELDYADVPTLTAALKHDQPEFLINAAGYTGKPNVDACELHKTDCLFGNAVLPGNIATACEAAGVPWGHVSSGCIYTGNTTDGLGFKETDTPNFSFRTDNCSFYSGTKALGEEILQDARDCFIWRLRIPFDHRESPRNYLTKLMRYDRLFDAINSVSQLQEFVAATFACWEKRIPFGCYNVTNPGPVSAREVVALIKASGVCDKTFAYFENEAQFMSEAAKAPRSNCVLNTGKLSAVGIELTDAREAIKIALRNWAPTRATVA